MFRGVFAKRQCSAPGAGTDSSTTPVPALLLGAGGPTPAPSRLSSSATACRRTSYCTQSRLSLKVCFCFFQWLLMEYVRASSRSRRRFNSALTSQNTPEQLPGNLRKMLARIQTSILDGDDVFNAYGSHAVRLRVGGSGNHEPQETPPLPVPAPHPLQEQ